MPGTPEIVIVAKADETHPRQSGASLVELNDGSIFLAWDGGRHEQFSGR